MSTLKTIFPDHWQYIVDVYRRFIFSAESAPVKEKLALILLDIGVRFGQRLSTVQVTGFVEIGCGLAIPSLTLATLGGANVTAVDIDPKVLLLLEALRERVGCNFQIECRDIFKDRPELRKGQILIAEKPASYKKNTLEVEYNISNWCKIEGHNLALIPTFLNSDTRDSYSERCAKYEKKLRQVGFKVENKQACDELPLRWLIAVK